MKRRNTWQPALMVALLELLMILDGLPSKFARWRRDKMTLR
jgi:hypothetical protein